MNKEEILKVELIEKEIDLPFISPKLFISTLLKNFKILIFFNLFFLFLALFYIKFIPKKWVSNTIIYKSELENYSDIIQARSFLIPAENPFAIDILKIFTNELYRLNYEKNQLTNSGNLLTISQIPNSYGFFTVSFTSQSPDTSLSGLKSALEEANLNTFKSLSAELQTLKELQLNTSNTFEEKKQLLKLNTDFSKLRAFKTVGDIKRPLNPSFPKKEITFSLAIILANILGVTLIFLINDPKKLTQNSQ